MQSLELKHLHHLGLESYMHKQRVKAILGSHTHKQFSMFSPWQQIE
jgi:hypothetical protein